MKRIFRALLFWTLILSACSAGVASPQALPSRTATPDPKSIPSLGTSPIDLPPDPQACGYQWAYEDLPELSRQLQDEIKALDPAATARATAFGEDCVYTDGHADFLAMQTDFYIELPVSDLTDFESFGNWMAQTMQVIDSLPPDLIAGPKDGFVEFRFTASQADFLIVRVPIQGYRETASGKTGEELFRMFYSEP